MILLGAGGCNIKRKYVKQTNYIISSPLFTPLVLSHLNRWDSSIFPLPSMSIVSSINFNICELILEIDRQRRLREIGVILSVELDVYHSLRGEMIEYP